MTCLFTNCIAPPGHAVEDCTTLLLRDGWPKLPCVMCENNTRGSTSLGPWRTALCWKCFQRHSDQDILAAITRRNGGGVQSPAPSSGRPPLRSAPRHGESRPTLRSPPRR